jgi:hypothetical protein
VRTRAIERKLKDVEVSEEGAEANVIRLASAG